MTIPPNGGNDPFDYTNDTVSAKVTVDVPRNTVLDLEQVVDKADQLRVAMEAAARANGDFVEYLREMPTLMSTAADARTRFQDAVVVRAGTDSSVVPLSGRGDPRQVGSASGLGSGNDRGGVTYADEDNADDVRAQIEDLERRDPRQAANMRAQRRPSMSRPPAPDRPGRGRPANRPDSRTTSPDNPENPDPSPDDPGTRDYDRLLRDYTQRTQGFLNTVLRETRSGTTGVSNIGTVLGGIESIARQGQQANEAREGGNPIPAGVGLAGRLVGGNAGLLLRGAGVAGVAYAGLQASQAVGEQYQQYKNAGMVQGGGFAAGANYEAQARMLAMNPFINTDQARQVINSALTEGYTGKEFDTVTKFMADNLKNMNLQVADSVKLLNTQVVQGGQSIVSLSDQLGNLKELSKDGYMTFENRKQMYSQVASQGVGIGLSGAEAGELGTIATEMWKDDKQLSGVGGTLASTLMSNTNLQLQIAKENGYTGMDPSMALSASIDEKGSSAVMKQGVDAMTRVVGPDLLKRYREAKNSAEKGRALSSIENILKGQFGLNLPRAQLESMVDQMAAGTLGSEIEAADKRITDTVEEVKPGGFGGFMSDLTSGFQWAGRFVGSGLNAIDDTVGGGLKLLGMEGGWGALGDTYKDTVDSWQGWGKDMENRSAQYKNDRIQALVEKYGSGDIMVQGPNGVEKLNQGDKAMIEEIAKGKRQISVGGSEFATLSDTMNRTESGAESGNVTHVEVILRPTGGLENFISSSVGRTSTQQAADAGRSNSSYNSPSVTDGKPWTTSGGN